MSTWRWFVVCGCTVLLLSSCQPSPKEISKQVKKSLAFIYYQNKPGYGTGFFVQEKGNKEGCNVLTARHVLPLNTNIKLQTFDQEIWEVSDIQRFPNHDLAVINFKVDNKNECPYQALNIGNFDNVDVPNDIYIAGFQGNVSQMQLTSGKVSLIEESNIDGYGISYTAITASGMSGGPVINTSGKVIGVHGRTNVELSQIAEEKGEELPPQEQSTGGQNFKPGDSVGTFKWGIPINAYVEYFRKKFERDLQAINFYNQSHNFLASKNYKKALEYYDQAIAIKPIKHDNYKFWNNRGQILYKLKRYEEAIESYDKAIAMKPDNYQIWNNRGQALYKLKRYEEAIESYDKVIAIKPNYYLAWYSIGVNLKKIKRYEEAIESYDKVIAIKPDYYLAWSNRGDALSELKRYPKAIESYNKATKIKHNYDEAWYKRGNALSELELYQEALESYNKAIKFNPNNEKAINNRKLLLKKLNE